MHEWTDNMTLIARTIDSYKRGPETAEIGTFSWNHSLTLNISGSNKDIFENEAPIDSIPAFS